MTILRERVHLNWEVFNWYGYLGYSYIRIAHPISQEFPKKLRPMRSEVEMAQGRSLSSGVYTEKLVLAVVSSIPAFFSHSRLEATLELAVSYNCPLWVGCVTVTTAAAWPEDGLKGIIKCPHFQKMLCYFHTRLHLRK